MTSTRATTGFAGRMSVAPFPCVRASTEPSTVEPESCQLSSRSRSLCHQGVDLALTLMALQTKSQCAGDFDRQANPDQGGGLGCPGKDRRMPITLGAPAFRLGGTRCSA